MTRKRRMQVAAWALWVTAGCGDDSTNPFDADGSGTTSNPATATGTEASTATLTTTAVDDTGSGGASSGEATTDDPIFDVGGGDIDIDGCGCELQYIWISNADHSTVSKIDTETLVEEGRYITRPDSAGNPSRTSVNLAGDVAIANRHGGLVKFYADPDDCIESNGMPGIQTSTGANNVLGWDVEECRAWYTEFPTTNQRPVAWTPGDVVPGTCDSQNEKVWTVASAVPGLGPGIGGAGGVNAYLVNGDDGSIEQEILIEEFSGFQLGAYGGAVDTEGNLYFSPMGAVTFGGQLARVDIQTFDVTLWPLPQGLAPYGITVDHTGKVWLSGTLGAGAGRFDPDTETWDLVQAPFISAGGLAEGQDGNIWIATDNGAASVNAETLALGPTFTTNMGGTVKGISVDRHGYVWAVNQLAYKVDPATGTAVDFYNGLSSPYTYSDMTGWALSNVTCPPAG